MAVTSIRPLRPPPHQVIAEFAGSVVAFRLPRDATFGDLATCMASLGLSYRGAPISVEVTIGLC
jgi:hypothetical protein